MNFKLPMLMLLGLLVSACGERGSAGEERLIERAVSAYEYGDDEAALTLFERGRKSADTALLANALLSDIYMVRARLESDPGLALKAIEYDEAMGPARRPDLAQYRSYSRAVSLDVLGQSKEARRLLEGNCETSSGEVRCALIPEFSRSVVDAPRFEAEALYSITSALLDHGFTSELIVATNRAGADRVAQLRRKRERAD